MYKRPPTALPYIYILSAIFPNTAYDYVMTHFSRILTSFIRTFSQAFEQAFASSMINGASLRTNHNRTVTSCGEHIPHDLPKQD